MNRRGILVPYIAKMAIAVVCILLLVYLMVSLAGIFTQDTKAQQAKAILDDLERTINDLEEGKTSKFVLLYPSGWVLTGWPVKERIPSECIENNWEKCLCLCSYAKMSFKQFLKAVGRGDIPNGAEDFKNACNELSYCIKINEEEISINSNWLGRFLGANNAPIFIDELLDEGENLLIKKEKTKEGVKLIIEAEKSEK